MAEGFLSVGQCWPNSAQAIDAFYSTMPQTHAMSSNTNQARSFNFKDSTGWKTQFQNWNGSSWVTVANVTAPSNVYGTCEYNAETSWDYTGAAALWAFAFTSVISLWYLSKNLGIIIDAVRRW